MAYAERRKGKTTGVWLGEVVLPPVMGVRSKVRERFKTKDEAERWEGLVRLTGEVPNRLEQSRIAAEGIRFEEVAKRLDEQGGPGGVWARSAAKRRHRRNNSEELRRAAVRERFGKMPVKLITYSAVEDYVAVLRKQGCSPATINRYLSALSAYLAYAERRGDIERRPQLPWQEESKKRQPYYTDVQVKAVTEALRAAGHDIDAMLCEVLNMTGLRVGELLELTPRQIDDEGYITLDDPEAIKNGEVRTVYVGQPLGRNLRAAVANNRLPRYTTLRRRLTEALESAGLETTRALHAFRHTAATRTVQYEQDLQVAQRLLGHKNSRTTERYRHIAPEVMRERAKKVSQRAGQTRGEVVEVDFTQPRQDLNDPPSTTVPTTYAQRTPPFPENAGPRTDDSTGSFERRNGR